MASSSTAPPPEDDPMVAAAVEEMNLWHAGVVFTCAHFRAGVVMEGFRTLSRRRSMNTREECTVRRGPGHRDTLPPGLFVGLPTGLGETTAC